MKNRWIGIPSGLKDELGSETARRGGLAAAALESLAQAGFRQVKTPVLEYYDLFAQVGLPMRPETMVKLEDRQGRLCVMRPESTIPVARLVATKLKNDPKPLKISYAQPVFRVLPDGKLAQHDQAGVECFGTQGMEADLELLRLLLSTLRKMGMLHPQLEIGHAGLIPALLPTLGLSEEDEARLMESFVQRNFAVMTDILKQCPNRRQADTLSRLVMLTGDRDGWQVLEQELEGEAREILKSLRETAVAMTGEDVLLDASAVTNMDYYTGIIFRVYAPGAPREVAVGGRYDGLMQKFEQSCPSIGFVMDLDVLADLAVEHE